MDLSRTDSGRMPAAPVASGAAVAALGSALQGRMRGRLSEAELRRAIRSVCVEARRHGVRAEQLLVVFKRALVSALDAHGVPVGEERDGISARLVSACIEEFYAVEAAA